MPWLLLSSPLFATKASYQPQPGSRYSVPWPALPRGKGRTRVSSGWGWQTDLRLKWEKNQNVLLREEAGREGLGCTPISGFVGSFVVGLLEDLPVSGSSQQPQPGSSLPCWGCWASC